MLQVVKLNWALLIGILLLMLGNGVQATLLGVRGAVEGYTTFTMSIIMSGYFIGFLGGSKLAPQMIKRVGHVRVFAALASLISAVMILYAAFPSATFWTVLRIIIGFCFSGVYVVAESWLNDNSTNQTRGQVLSVYVIVQLLGIVSAQALLNFGDPGGYFLFVISSVLVSIAFAPILLSVSPAPLFETAKPMSVRDLVRASPLGATGAFCLGALFAGLWGMSSVFGTQVGLSVREISIFVAAIYVGGMIFQYPVGWFSDRFDRRKIILAMAAISAIAAMIAVVTFGIFAALISAALVIGGVVNPMYTLVVAYSNDMLEPEDMPAAAGALIFLNGLGAAGGPLVVGWIMTLVGPVGFFVYIAAVMAFLAFFTLFRMALRPAVSDQTTGAYTPVGPTITPVAMDMVQEIAIETQQEEESEDQEQSNS